MKKFTNDNDNVALLDPKEESKQTKPAPHAKKPEPVREEKPSKSIFDDDEEEEPSLFRRLLIPGIIGIVLIGGGYAMVKGVMGDKSTAKKPPEVTRVNIQLPPPPPPPPPPPQPPQPQEQKVDNMIKEEKPDEQPQEQDTPQIGTSIQGPGAGSMQLGRGDKGNVFGNKGGQESPRAKWSRYATQVQSRMTESLRNNPKTRKASMRVELRVWVDNTGRVTKVVLNGSTGDAALDGTLKNEVFPGLQISEPPPDGMPMPIVMRVTGRRPN